MVYVRFNGATKSVRARGLAKSAALKLRRRWLIRVHLRGMDASGEPARGLAEARLPKAVTLSQARTLIDAMLHELGAIDLREFTHLGATWVAVSES